MGVFKPPYGPLIQGFWPPKGGLSATQRRPNSQKRRPEAAFGGLPEALATTSFGHYTGTLKPRTKAKTAILSMGPSSRSVGQGKPWPLRCQGPGTYMHHVHTRHIHTHGIYTPLYTTTPARYPWFLGKFSNFLGKLLNLPGQERQPGRVNSQKNYFFQRKK